MDASVLFSGMLCVEVAGWDLSRTMTPPPPRSGMLACMCACRYRAVDVDAGGRRGQQQQQRARHPAPAAAAACRHDARAGACISARAASGSPAGIDAACSFACTWSSGSRPSAGGGGSRAAAAVDTLARHGGRGGGGGGLRGRWLTIDVACLCRWPAWWPSHWSCGGSTSAAYTCILCSRHTQPVVSEGGGRACPGHCGQG